MLARELPSADAASESRGSRPLLTDVLGEEDSLLQPPVFGRQADALRIARVLALRDAAVEVAQLDSVAHHSSSARQCNP